MATKSPSKPWPKLSPEDRAKLRAAVRLRKQKVPWRTIAQRLECSASFLRWRLDISYNQGRKRNARIRAKRDYSNPTGFTHNTGPRPISQAELEYRQSLIPEDTRDYTARWFGDPIRPDPRRPSWQQNET